MLYEWADKDAKAEIDEALIPPPDWRDPATGLPAGFGEEDEEWALWESQMRR